TLAEMYLQGVSTRRVTKVMETLCGFQVSSNQVSKATKELDEQIEAWRTRPIEPIAHLVLDAMYEDVRYDKLVAVCARLWGMQFDSCFAGLENDGLRRASRCRGF
ncbi:MAG: transposase, partial [Akkermansiaceae bacterium]